MDAGLIVRGHSTVDILALAIFSDVMLATSFLWSWPHAEPVTAERRDRYVARR